MSIISLYVSTMSVFVLVGVVLFILLVMILSMVAGVFMRGKPIQHCGGGQITHNGEKITCPACLDDGECIENDPTPDATASS